jgi:hypothetical protein
MEPKSELRRFVVALVQGSAAEQALTDMTDGTLNELKVLTCSSVESTDGGLLRLRRIPLRQPGEGPGPAHTWWLRAADVAAIREFDGEPTRVAGFLPAA